MIDLFIGIVTGVLAGAALRVFWLLLDPGEDPASHAVAHAEGWPCSCRDRS